MNRTREEKLSPALHLARDLADLRMKLLSYQQPHTRLAEWLEDAIVRINRATNEKRWLPIWWRYGTIDANASGLAHAFHRADSEGFFYAESKSGYLPEREEILRSIDSIYNRYKAARS